MQRHLSRMLAAVSAVAAVVAVAPAAAAAPYTTSSPALLAGDRPAFKMPFRCGQVWNGNNWQGHSPAHSIDWNHYDSSGTPDDYGRRVLASAGGKVIVSHFATDNGYGNTIVVAHGNGWQTRYAHLKTRSVARGDHVNQGQLIGDVGKSSAIYTLSPHLHYEQIHNGQVVVSVVQGVTWSDFLQRNQTSKNGCS